MVIVLLAVLLVLCTFGLLAFVFWLTPYEPGIRVILVGIVLTLFVLCGIGLNDLAKPSAPEEVIALKKSEWACTNWENRVVPVAMANGNGGVTMMPVNRRVCQQYNRQ